MTIAAGLVLSRFVHYVALSVLFGGALFPFYGVESAQARQRMSEWLRAPLLVAALLAFASSLSWFAFTAAGMTPDFGFVWVLRLLLAAILVLPLFGNVTAQRLLAVVFGSLILLASIAWSGHAGADASATATPHMVADIFHLVAAGVWGGALFVFARLTARNVRQAQDLDLRIFHDALTRFSGIGPIVVAVLVLSGIFLIGLQKISTVFAMDYGRILLIKLAMFGAMLLLAAANRFWLTPRLSATLDSMKGLATALGALRISLLAETVLAVFVLAAAAWLGNAPSPGTE